MSIDHNHDDTDLSNVDADIDYNDHINDETLCDDGGVTVRCFVAVNVFG